MPGKIRKWCVVHQSFKGSEYRCSIWKRRDQVKVALELKANSEAALWRETADMTTAAGTLIRHKWEELYQLLKSCGVIDTKVEPGRGAQRQLSPTPRPLNQTVGSSSIAYLARCKT